MQHCGDWLSCTSYLLDCCVAVLRDCVQVEWMPSAEERESEVERTVQQMAVLKQVAEDPESRLP